jgi:hypothetical protein
LATKPLSNRAELLLGVVREGSDPDTGRTWIPRERGTYRIYGEIQDGYGLTVSGSGDVQTLKALERRGLISPSKLTYYAYIITDAGIAEYEKIAARRVADRKSGKVGV